jgi:hypothetical protein
MLRACSFTLALASRNEGLVAAVERDRVKVRDAEALGADDARIFTAAKDMTVVLLKCRGKKLLTRMTDSIKLDQSALLLSD